VVFRDLGEIVALAHGVHGCHSRCLHSVVGVRRKRRGITLPPLGATPSTRASSALRARLRGSGNLRTSSEPDSTLRAGSSGSSRSDWWVHSLILR
jgi:hypothetical protein